MVRNVKRKMINPKQWTDFDEKKYDEIYQNRKATHDFFRKWVKYHHIEIQSALEIGGGKSKTSQNVISSSFPLLRTSLAILSKVLDIFRFNVLLYCTFYFILIG